MALGTGSNPKHFSTKDRFAHLAARHVPDGGSDPNSTEVEQPKYKAQDFIVPSADSNGRSGRCQCRVPPLIVREMQEILASRRFPFRTDSDITRWCILYGLSALAEMEPSPGFLQRAQAELEILRDEEVWALQQEVVRKLDESVKRYTDAGQYGEARRLVLEALARFKDSKDEKWKEIIIDEIRAKFKHTIEYSGA